MQPDIYLGDLRIAEPVITLTGLGIAGVCLYAWLRLGRLQPILPAQRWMRYFFGSMTISSLIGPFFGHAFNYWAGFPGKYGCWVFSMLALTALAQAAIVHAAPVLRAGWNTWLTRLNWTVFGLALVIAARQQTSIG